MDTYKLENSVISEFIDCNNLSEDLARKSCLNRKCLEIALKDSPIIVALCDLELRYIWIHNAHSDYLSENMIGKRDDELDTNGGILKLMELKRKTIKIGKRFREEIEFPLSEGLLTYDVTAEPLRDSEGNIIGCSTSSIDITHIKRLQKYLVNAENLKAVGQLAAGVSHEFNNILAVIMGNLQLFLLEFEQNKNTISDKHIDKIKKMIIKCEQGKNIALNLLSLAKPSVPKKELTDISTVVDRVISLQQSELVQDNITIERKYSPIKRISIDVGQIEQVFLNLSINALHAMKPLGKGLLTISIKEVDNEVEVRFSDTGIGINNIDKDRIFDPFFTTKNDCFKGSGLGLTMVIQCIKSHNGTISFESQVNKGTTFIIRLPIDG